MAESPDKAAESAEKAYAAAAEKAKPVASETPKPVAAPVTDAPAPASEPAAAESAPEPAKAEPVPAKKPVVAKVAPKKAVVKKKAAPKKVPAKIVKKPAARNKPVAGKKPVFAKQAAPAAKPAAIKPEPTITELKEKIMATAKTPDFMKTVTDALSELQSKAKEAYEKSTAYAGEMTDFAKGNVEAIVESGKVFSTGVQDMGKTAVDEAKSAYETITADMKEMAAIKSPSELFQLQGKLARRNFDAMVAYSSKTGDTVMKLYSDAFAPISGRVSLAAEKLSKAA
ncbi:phasin family protein [Altererythrobacter salegens]|uniref:Phasin family protein n=1 Tax=Croceibacterium salegens TaxID=1737568 RepID=A0A6I4SUZ5_9SPHN|nr:phasin family protein [Croceibacterium salegens]MXO59835.1 phasin family protein [Croceibacterium salegens]